MSARWRNTMKKPGYYIMYMPGERMSEHLIYYKNGKYSFGIEFFGNPKHTYSALEKEKSGFYRFYGPIALAEKLEKAS